MESRKFEIYNAILNALKTLEGVEIVEGHPTAGNRQLVKQKVLGLSLGNESWSETQRPHCKLTLWVDCFYKNAYREFADFLEFEEQVIRVLLSNWDYNLDYVKASYVENITTDEGFLTPHGSFHIEIRVEYFRDVRET